MPYTRRSFLTGLSALSATALLTGAATGTATAGSRTVGPASWMRGLSDGTDLRTLTIPGSHDSGARHGGPWTECQNTAISAQLTSGIRFLDIRCRLFDGAFSIHHGAVYQHLNFDDVLGACRDFLAAHPSETVLMRVQQEYSQESAEAFAQVFEEYLDRGWRTLFHLDSTLPQLGRARGSVVLLGDSDGLPGVRYGDPELFDIQDEYMTEPLGKLGLIEDHFRKAVQQPGKLFVNYVSTAALLPPRSNADRLNPRVVEFLSAEGSGWHGLGIVPMDFPNEHGATEALLAHQPTAAPHAGSATR